MKLTCSFCRSEVEQDDEVDSDFSIDENDELVSDTEDDPKAGKKKAGRLVTKAYKVSHHHSFSLISLSLHRQYLWAKIC